MANKVSSVFRDTQGMYGKVVSNETIGEGKEVVRLRELYPSQVNPVGQILLVKKNVDELRKSKGHFPKYTYILYMCLCWGHFSSKLRDFWSLCVSLTRGNGYLGLSNVRKCVVNKLFVIILL